MSFRCFFIASALLAGFLLVACSPKQPAPVAPQAVEKPPAVEPSAPQPDPEEALELESEKPEALVYYSAEQGLPLYPRPRFTEPVALLDLNQRVLRYRLHKGFAFVRVESLGLSGWVDNAKLDWRKAGATDSPVLPDELSADEPFGATRGIPAVSAEPEAQAKPAGSTIQMNF